jgi:tRNA (guanine37-N1)-methyltransferase
VDLTSSTAGVILVCGRYEGVDQRFLDYFNIKELSIGDFVLFGGEVAAQAVLESCVRLLPNVVNNSTTCDEESFSQHLLEYPHYTRPSKWRGMEVPAVLLSGNHKKVADWRYQQSCKITQKMRPDLWQCHLKKI